MKGLFGLVPAFLAAVAVAGPILERATPAPLHTVPAGVETTGGYIVVLKDDANPHAQISALGLPAGTGRVFNGVLKGYSGHFDEATLNIIRASPQVEFVEPDIIMHATNLQTPAEYGLAISCEKNTISTSQQNKYYYDANAGSGVKAYIIDTGINAGHSDFGGRATLIANYVSGSPNTDENGHGTHCAGTIGGATYGIAKNVTLNSIKVLDAQGSGSTSNIVSGINYAVQHCNGGKCVISMSLGGASNSALNQAVNNAYNNGVGSFVAAGNDGTDACNTSPANAQYAYTVAALDKTYTRASFSNYGQCVNIFGPGVNVKSDWIGSSTATNTISGTSMATPHIAGIAAYYLSFASMTPSQLYQTITNNAQKNIVSDTQGSPNALGNNGYFIKHPSSTY